MKVEIFGKTATDEEVHAIRLENENGTAAVVITYGGILKNFFVKNKNGTTIDIVTGYDDLTDKLILMEYESFFPLNFNSRFGYEQH